MTAQKIDSDIKNLVLWRIETSVPKHFKLSMGNLGTFSKEELKRHVEAEDEIGLKIIDMQLKFIRDLSRGEFSRKLAETDDSA